MIKMTVRAALTAALALGVAWAGAAAAQSWRMQPRGTDADAFALIDWPSGVYMISRCRGGELVMAMTLARPMQGQSVEVTYAFDGGAGVRTRWSLSDNGGGVIISDPAPFARTMAAARSLTMSITDGQGPRQRYDLPLRAPARDLEAVLATCGLAAA